MRVRARNHLPTVGRGAAYVVVVLVFAISRIVYRSWYGLRFDTSPTTILLQYLDPWFVEHDFWRSLLYLHHQAPLQILLAQGSIKLLGIARASVLLDGLYVAMGLLLSVAILSVLLRLATPPALAAIAVCLFEVRPTAILYEEWLFYPLPTALLIVCSLVALLRYYRRGTIGSAVLFFGVLATLALLRATFGSVFICLAAGLLLLRPAPGPVRRAQSMILKAAAVPLLVVVLNYAKTSWLVGHSFGTALLWQNLCEKIYVRLPAGEVSRLVSRGVLTPVAGYRGLLRDASTLGPYRVEHAPTGVPLLDFDEVPGGAPNPHALEHVLVAERYYRPDALYLLEHNGGDYWRSVWGALTTQYVWSATFADGLSIGLNYGKLDTLRATLDRATGSTRMGRSLALIIALPLAWLYGVARLLGTRTPSEGERASLIAIAYMLLTIAYSSGVTLLISYGDFSRYRYDVDAFYLILLVLLFAELGRFMRRGPRRFFRRTPEPASDLGGKIAAVRSC